MAKLLFLFIMCACSYGYTQSNFQFDYSPSGNMTQRKVLVFPDPPSARFAGNDNSKTNAVSQLTVYPNPTSSKVTLEGKLPEGINTADVYLNNDQGQAIIKTSFAGDPTDINVANLQPAVYYLTVYYSLKHKEVFKVIITK